jgi:O-antigen/teichoic acid export membrane protein
VASRVPRGATVSSATTAGILACGAVAGIVAAWLLGPSGKGALALGGVWFGLLSQLGDLGVNQAVTFFISRDPARAGEHWGRSVVIASAQALVIVPAGLLLSGALVHSPTAVPAVRIGVVAVPFSLFLGYELSVLRGLERFGVYNALRLCQSGLWLASVIAFAALSVRSATGLMVCLLGAVAVTGAIATVVVVRAIGLPRIGIRGSRALMAYGSQVWIGAVANQCNANVDQLILGAFAAAAALGQYSVAVSVASLLTVISTGLGVVTLPAVARADARSRPVIARHNLRLGFGLMFMAAVAIGLAGPFVIPAVLGPAFRPAVPLLEILLLGQVALGSTQILHEIARGMGRLRLPAVIETVGAAFTVGLLLLTVPRWGAHAAAWVSVAVYWPVAAALWFALLRRPGIQSADAGPGPHPADVPGEVRAPAGA